MNGVTKWCKTWEKNGWKLNDKSDVKNQDLWGFLLLKLRELRCSFLMPTSFWLIPRGQNTAADRAANIGKNLPRQTKFGMRYSYVVKTPVVHHFIGAFVDSNSLKQLVC